MNACLDAGIQVANDRFASFWRADAALREALAERSR